MRAKVDGNVRDLGARGSLPTTSRFTPYGRLSWNYLDMSSTLIDGDSRTHLNDYQNAFSWAVGTAFGLNRRLALGGEYAKTMIDDADLDSVSVNLSYRFGTL